MGRVRGGRRQAAVMPGAASADPRGLGRARGRDVHRGRGGAGPAPSQLHSRAGEQNPGIEHLERERLRNRSTETPGAKSGSALAKAGIALVVTDESVPAPPAHEKLLMETDENGGGISPLNDDACGTGSNRRGRLRCTALPARRNDPVPMLFNSFTFLIFLAVVLPAVAWARRRSHRVENWVLVAAGCVFYGWWDWRFLGCSFSLPGSISSLPGRSRRRKRSGASGSSWRCSLGTNLTVLGFFKYCNFFASSLAHLLRPLGVPMPDRLLRRRPASRHLLLHLPGDVLYHRRLPGADRGLPEHPRDFLTYITFFPQLVAGPIERAGEMLPQYRSERQVTAVDIAEGLYLVLWGYTKKTVVADNLGLKVDRIFSQGTFHHGRCPGGRARIRLPDLCGFLRVHGHRAGRGAVAGHHGLA